MKISWKNIENWRSWKMRFFWGGHFEFSKSAILNFFLLHISEKPSPYIWGIIFFWTMDGSSRILEKKGGGLLCTRLYLDFHCPTRVLAVGATIFLVRVGTFFYNMDLNSLKAFNYKSLSDRCVVLNSNQQFINISLRPRQFAWNIVSGCHLDV